MEKIVKKTLMALDGNNLLNRAFFGVRPLTTRDGLPTNAVFGFMMMLQKFLQDFGPDAVCVVFDMPGGSFRDALYDGYKGERKPMEADLATQLPLCKELLAALRIPVYGIEQYEADDVLGTIGCLCKEAGWLCDIVSGDKDMFQLINDDVRVLRVGTKETRVMNAAAVQEEYGLPPASMLDLKALMGDPSDHIPGVPGIGVKSALQLLHDFGSLDAIYERIDEVPEKFRKKLIPGKDSAYLSKKLGKIHCEVPFPFAPEHCLRHTADGAALEDLFRRLEFTKFLGKWLQNDSQKDKKQDFADNEIPLPQGVARDAKALWRGELDRGETPSEIQYDARLAAWLLGCNEYAWEDMRRDLERDGLWKLFMEMEMPLARVLAGMEHYGVKLDRRRLIAYGGELATALSVLEREITQMAGGEINILSPKQLGELLFEKLGLPKGRKTKTGWSTDADTLDMLRFEHPIVEKILEFRTVSKLKSTYADGLLKVMDDQDRVHSTFQMTATVTGRLSSTEPNLQNIPIRTELGARLREMFIPSQPGWVLVDADYSQIELRVLAHIAEDEVMRRAFANGEDIHTVTASQVFGISPDMVTPLMRRHAKAVNFGIVYGISDFSLAADIGVSRAMAKEYIAEYLEKYPGVRRYMTDIVEQAYRDGYVTTLYGRRRSLPELGHKNFNLRKHGERAALNAPIQGSAADIIKMAMIVISKQLRDHRLQARLILQVHDELIVECPAEEAETVCRLLQDAMEQVYPLNPALVAKAHKGENWAAAK